MTQPESGQDYELRYRVIDELCAMVKVDRQAVKLSMGLDDATLDILQSLNYDQRELLARNFHKVFNFLPTLADIKKVVKVKPICH